MGIIIALVLGLAIGVFAGITYARRAPLPGTEERGVPERRALARAWQEGYDAGSLASAAPVTPAPLTPALTAPNILPAPPRPPVQRVSPPAPLTPALSPEELAEARQRRDRRNVNVTLYTACLLLVAAASLFIGAALPVTARVAGLAVVVGLFYAVGLLVHGASRTLRPAGTAFTGTGLALVPVAGIALDLLVVHHPPTSWLLTSAAGTVLMVLAAVRLDSRVVAYLTVPFLLSTVMASGAAVQRGMVWALIASIGLAVLMAWLSAEPGSRSRWMPSAYREATARTHQWIVPGTVAAGMVLGVWLEPVQMLLLLLAASAYYATVAVIGPRRFRLASAYAVRGGVLAALLSWAAMLEWSTGLTLTALVAYLCLQIPLVHVASGAGGYLPSGPAALVDLGACWALAVLSALGAQVWRAGPGRTALGSALELAPGIGWAAVIVAVTTAVFSLVFLRAGIRPGREASAAVWQAATPLSMVPLLAYSASVGGTERAWNPEVVLGATLVVQSLILGHLWRAGHRHRIDARIAPHVMAAAGVALAYLLTDRLTDSLAERLAERLPEPPGGASAALLVAALAALAWATVTALQHGPLPGGPGVRLPVGVWTGAGLLALVALLGVQGPALGGGTRWGWYSLAVVTGAVSLWWLGRGAGLGEHPRVDAARPAIAGVGILVLVATTVRFAVADGAAPEGQTTPALEPWHVVIALVLLTGWLVTAAVVTGGRLQEPLRVAALLAGQGSAAVLVATVTDRLGGDGSAARAAAAVALVAGLALRQRLALRERLALAWLSGPAASWLVTGAAGLLWVIELGAGGDRAALMVMAAALVAAGMVLGGGRGGHWAVLAGATALVVAASPWFGLTGGWLPEPLYPTRAASALLVLLALAVMAREIAVAARRPAPEGGPSRDPGASAGAPNDGVPSGGVAGIGAAGVGVAGDRTAGPPWWADPAVFRPAAVLILGATSLVLALAGDVGGTPHAGALAVTVAAGALASYVFARTRGVDWLTLATVVGVPVTVSLLTIWWQDRGLWFPDGDWRALGSGLLGLAILGGWAVLDGRADARVDARADDRTDDRTVARTEARGEDPAGGDRAAILWQGGLAVVLVTAVATVLDVGVRAGQPGDAVVWASLASAVAALWLTVAAWGRHLLWPGLGRPAAWALNGRDAAVVLTWAAASRAWWQTATVADPGRAFWWHVQVLVLVLVGLGLWHALRSAGRGAPPTTTDRARWFFFAAAAVFTLAAAYVLGGGTAGMQLAVLIGFALLVVLGLTRREQPLTWWGASGVALSVLWYLRGYTYVYLALLGLVLIVLAVRQLRRHQARQVAGQDVDGAEAAGVQPGGDR